MTSDVVIVGGGVIGLSIAWELAQRGVGATVLDRGPLGQEASWAGAGMLPPGCLARAVTPEGKLRGLSHDLWPGWSAMLREETGLDNGFRHTGGLEVLIPGARHDHSDLDTPPSSPAPSRETAHLADEVRHWAGEGIACRSLSVASALELEPALAGSLSDAYFLPEMCQVRNPWHLKALVAACNQRGVRLRPGDPALDFERHADRIRAVLTPTGRIETNQVVLTAGAWTGTLAERLGLALALVPVRGQIVLLHDPRQPLKHILTCSARYLVPREDGRILIGATEELAGFEKRNTSAGVSGLLEFATRLVPALAEATVERTWSGLRPCTPDRLPYLGQVSGFENVYLAAGHFRAGLSLSPATGHLMRQLLLGDRPSLDLSPYQHNRT